LAEVLGWPQDRFGEWQREVNEYLAALGRPAEPDETEAVQFAAYCVLHPGEPRSRT